MYYRDQLILTGKINDVGAYTRTNTDKSYRAGVELQGTWKPLHKLQFAGNLTLSDNKILNFTEYLDDYDNGGQVEKFYSETNISYSPAVTGMAGITWLPFNNAEIQLTGKYVGRQFLDNTSNKSRSIDAYYTQDLRLSYNVNLKDKKALQFFVNLNNIFNKKYEANGYSFSYFYDHQLTTENYYFPMAPFNFLAGINVKL
jgi:iron complex outermembrane receptor protein